MKKIVENNFSDTVFKYFFLFLCPLLAFAPLGIWIPLIASTIIFLFFSEKFFFKLKKEVLFMILIVFLSYIFLNSIILSNISNKVLEVLISTSVLIIAGYIISKLIIDIKSLNTVIIFFAISFTFSCLIILSDIFFGLGLKMWLSQNFDFNNFKSFLQLKSWINYEEFKINNLSLINTHLIPSYNRSIIGLMILSLPLFILSYKLNYKIFSYLILIITLVLVKNANLAAKLTFVCSFFLSYIFYLREKAFIQVAYAFSVVYILFAPFLLNILDYKNFSQYEMHLKSKQMSFYGTYCNYATLGTDKCNVQNFQQFKRNLDTEYSKKDFTYDYLKFQAYRLISDEMLHRLVIWSYAKEKITNKLFFGYGLSSSRSIASQNITSVLFTNYQLMPLHPHNGVIQLWLELGLMGIIFFLIFIITLKSIIFKLARSNKKIGALALASYLQIFFISQTTFGFWQSWWLTIIIITFILYILIFKILEKE